MYKQCKYIKVKIHDDYAQSYAQLVLNHLLPLQYAAILLSFLYPNPEKCHSTSVCCAIEMACKEQRASL
jgi:hypothetical protein